jgi:histidinol-phosphate aminotransferase
MTGELGPSPAALAALTELPDLTRAPEPNSTTLQRALADRYELPAEAFLVGPGVASLLHGLVARHAAATPGPVVYSSPSFHLYRQLAAD